MTPRQEQILHAVVDEYTKTAAPVGSLVLSRQFGFSSATIRAELAELERLGYITHPHTSAGRLPTDKGYRHYVDWLEARTREVMARRDEERIDRVLERRISSAGGPQQAIKSAVDSLAEITQNLAVGMLGDTIYMYGLAQLLAQPEFMVAERAYQVARLIDNLEPWLRELAPHQELSVYIGQENPVGKLSGTSLIISRFVSPYSDDSYVGVVGPTRLSYPQVMHLVKQASHSLEEALNG